MEIAEMDATNLDFKNGGDSLSDAKMQAVQALHQQKVKILMKSVNALKEEIAALKAQNKDHRQARLVQAMRGKVREAELVADVLKGELCRTSSLSMEEVNELVMKKTLGGPKRFRPKIREELQNELSSLERQYKRALDKLKANARPPMPLPPPHATHSQGHADNSSRPPLLPNSPAAASQPSPMGGPCTVDVQAVGELMEQVEALRVAVRSRDVTLSRYMEEVERARQDAREYRMVSDRLAAKERKLESVSERLVQLESLYQAALTAQDTAHEELATHKAMTQLSIDEGRLENEALKQQCLEHMAQARELLQREGELVGELERCRHVWAQEKTALTREAKARDATLDEARKALASERSQRVKLEESVGVLEGRLLELQGAEGEVCAVRDKLREANLARTEAEKKWREGKERYDALHKSASQRKEEAKKRYAEAVESLSRDHSEQVLLRDTSLQQLQSQQDAARRELEEVRRDSAHQLTLAQAAATQALTDKQHALDALTAQLASLQASHQEAKALQEAARRDCGALKEAHAAELAKLKEQHEKSYAQTAASHQLQVDGVSAELSSLRASSNKALQELQLQLQLQQAQLQEAQSALSDARKAHLAEKGLWEVRLEEAKGLVRAYELDPPTSPKAAHALQALEHDRTQLAEHCARLEVEKRELEEAKAALATQLTDALKHSEEAKDRDEQHKAMQDKVRVLEEQAAQALGRADTLAAQVSSLEASSGEEGASLRAQMTDLRAQLEASSKALVAAENNLKDRDARLKAFHSEGQAILEEAKKQAALTQAAEEDTRKSLLVSKDESDRLDAHVGYLEALLGVNKVSFLPRPVNAVEASARRATVISGLPPSISPRHRKTSTPEPHIDDATFPRAMSPRSDDTFRLSDDSSNDGDSAPTSHTASTAVPTSPSSAAAPQQPPSDIQDPTPGLAQAFP